MVPFSPRSTAQPEIRPRPIFPACWNLPIPINYSLTIRHQGADYQGFVSILMLDNVSKTNAINYGIILNRDYYTKTLRHACGTSAIV